jgi:DNA primase
MTRRFSDKKLYEVRNHIPIRHVIETLLAIPSETVQGVFRFRCPLCDSRHTAVKPETNLSRCFHCARNFNTIDLCMLVKHLNFVESVKFLVEHKGQTPLAENKSAFPQGLISLEPKREPLKRPVPLHEILSELIPKGRYQKSNTTQKETPPISPTPNDIAELDRIAHDLSQILERLKASHQLK